MAFAALSTPALAQSREPAWIVGLSATVGNSWQFEGADFGIVRPIGFGPLRFASIAGRFGTFQDEGAFVFGSRGFVGAAVLATQTGSVSVFEVGTEQNPISIAVDLTLEASGYLASDSPFPQGSQWVGLAVLPGVRTLQSESFGLSLMVGPVWFIGHETDVRTFLGFRVEIPLTQPGTTR